MALLELAIQIGLRPQRTASTAGGEWHSECPVCGGTDRFYIQPYKQMNKCMGFYRCRQCGISGDAIQFAREFLHLPFPEAAALVNATLSDTPIRYLRKPTLSHDVLQETSFIWTIMATALVELAHQDILHNEQTLKLLSDRGISKDIVHHYKLGWIAQDRSCARSDWGLKELMRADGKPSKLWIPRGILIPTNKENGQVIRLKIRRYDWYQGDSFPKYVAVSGSMNGLTIIGSLQRDVMIVVESELDAYSLHAAAADFACVVAVGSNTKHPDNLTHHYAKRIRTLLICSDNDDEGEKMFKKWHSLYPHAVDYPTPFGKDVGEAIQLGLNVREWLLQAICS